jgi:hypothetical protein
MHKKKKSILSKNKRPRLCWTLNSSPSQSNFQGLQSGSSQAFNLDSSSFLSNLKQAELGHTINFEDERNSSLIFLRDAVQDFQIKLTRDMNRNQEKVRYMVLKIFDVYKDCPQVKDFFQGINSYVLIWEECSISQLELKVLCFLLKDLRSIFDKLSGVQDLINFISVEDSCTYDFSLLILE